MKETSLSLSEIQGAISGPVNVRLLVEASGGPRELRKAKARKGTSLSLSEVQGTKSSTAPLLDSNEASQLEVKRTNLNLELLQDKLQGGSATLLNLPGKVSTGPVQGEVKGTSRVKDTEL